MVLSSHHPSLYGVLPTRREEAAAKGFAREAKEEERFTARG